MKIITVTLNPAIDRTLSLLQLRQGGCSCVKQEMLDPGGKGINVSKTLLELGVKPVTVAFAGGHTGKELQRLAGEYGLEAVFIPIKGNTRTNFKIAEADGTVTELNEPGPELSKPETEKMLSYLQACADEETLFVLSGSIPGGVSTGIYAEIIRLVKGKGAKVLLDTSGEALSEGLKAGPDMVKPNQEELEQYFNRPLVSDEQVIQAGKELLSMGVCMSVVSMGARGAVFITEKEAYLAKGLKVKVHSTVGAGDAMAAALAYGASRKLSLPETAKLGIAVSAGAVTTHGTRPADRETVERLLEKVVLEPV